MLSLAFGFAVGHSACVLPWQDSEDDDGAEIVDGELSIWLVGGEEGDVNAFLDAIEQPDA